MGITIVNKSHFLVLYAIIIYHRYNYYSLRRYNYLFNDQRLNMHMFSKRIGVKLNIKVRKKCLFAWWITPLVSYGNHIQGCYKNILEDHPSGNIFEFNFCIFLLSIMFIISGWSFLKYIMFMMYSNFKTGRLIII